MSSKVSTSLETDKYNAATLCLRRWAEIVAVLPSLAEVSLHAEEGYSPHFDQPRGYAVTRGEPGAWTVVFAPKISQLTVDHVEALVRHELGHVLDFSIPTDALNALAASRGVQLPTTPERRADAIAELVWGRPIAYDPNDVQTLAGGIRPRPESLGL